MFERLALSLALTLALGLLFAWGWTVKGKDLLLVAAMNVLTNPLVVLWNTAFGSMSILISTVFPELAAIAAEAFLMRRFGKKIAYPLLLAVCINVFSYFSGLILSFFL